MSGQLRTLDDQRVDGGYVEPWERPGDWLALPSLAPGDQTVVGLVAVFDEPGNFLSVTFAGAYTIDWGDGGSPVDVASGVASHHQYDYSAIDVETLTSRGYKQVIVTITRQGGADLTSGNFHVRHTSRSTLYPTGWLDLKIAAALMTTLTINGTIVDHPFLEHVEIIETGTITSLLDLLRGCRALMSFEVPSTFGTGTTNFSGMFYQCPQLRAVPMMVTSSGTNFSNMFYQCYNLRHVPHLLTGSGTNFSNMFYECAQLQKVPLFNTASGTNFGNMFAYCYSISTIPLLNTGSGTSFNNMFIGASELQEVPHLVTGSSTTFASMFANCASLRTVPLLDTGSGTLFNNMFLNCYSLKEIPLINTAGGTNFTSMFNGCYSLKEIPALNTGNGLTFNSMFNNCYSLTEIPLLDTAKGTNLSAMFQYCRSLQKVPALVTTLCINFGYMFLGCSNLQVVPALNTAAASSATNTTLMFNTARSITKGRTNGIRYAVSYTGCSLSRSEIVEIFTGLGTAVGTQIVTVTNNWGSASLDAGDLLVAQDKGWTVSS
jgi:hypothetical protein